MKKITTIMGIDFGIANTIFLAFNNNNHYYSKKSAPVFKSHRKIVKGCDNTYETLDKYNYNTALYVVNMALKHHASIIQMEDLTGAEFTDNMFYFDLQRAIQTLGEEKCIIIRYVNKYMTSQRCSWCGFIDRGNRTSQSNFTCLKCGYSVNADYNASKNIATDNIETIIKATRNDCCEV